LKQVWDAAVRQGYPHGTLVQVLILTGQRRGEIANLHRSWIDPKERIITLPEWITKNGLEHKVPYDGLVSSVLEELPRLNRTELLFPSRASDEVPDLWVSDDARPHRDPASHRRASDQSHQRGHVGR